MALHRQRERPLLVDAGGCVSVWSRTTAAVGSSAASTVKDRCRTLVAHRRKPLKGYVREFGNGPAPAFTVTIEHQRRRKDMGRPEPVQAARRLLQWRAAMGEAAPPKARAGAAPPLRFQGMPLENVFPHSSGSRPTNRS
jgi:hypothetical protein